MPTRTAILLDWYARHARDLPWRARPGKAPDAYRVWLSEIMLQQTTVAAVKAYFLKFVELWPGVEDLAAADLDDVLRNWAGLGYYARARNLHKCARTVVADHGGRFPGTAADLQKLPGIGPYTAGAIAAIAFNEQVAAVDGNVERVITRQFDLRTPLPDVKPEVNRIVADLVPETGAGDFAQALMDLGATVCAPARPNCLICPWSGTCLGLKNGTAPDLPRKKPKKPRPVRYGTVFWAERANGAVLMRRRPERGLLGGMLEFPSTDWGGEPAGDPGRDAPVKAKWRQVPGEVEHVFTHFRLVLDVWRADDPVPPANVPDGDFRWIERHELAGEALPSVMKKVVAAVLGADALKPPPRQAAARR